LKHGPLALIDPHKAKTTSIILIALDDEYLHNMKTTISELHAIKAHITVITNCPEKLD